MANVEGEAPYDGWQRLKADLVKRWNAPRKNPTFVVFFVTTLILYSGAGFWLEVFKLAFGIVSPEQSSASIRSAIATYFPAIAGGAAMQLAISEALRSVRALGQLTAWVLGSIALVLVFAANLADGVAIALGLLGSAVALVFWWLVNAHEKSFHDDQPPPVAATGGEDTGRDLLGEAALAEFQQ